LAKKASSIWPPAKPASAPIDLFWFFRAADNGLRWAEPVFSKWTRQQAIDYGIEPSEIEADFDRNIVTKSLTALLANRGLLDKPRHVILPRGQALSIDAEQLKAQLAANEIPWPGATNHPSTA
jgi:hypothetical protein